MEQRLKEKIECMAKEISTALCSPATFYLYGSLILDDFQPGWSDIDFLCLTEAPLSQAEAEKLCDFRQQMREKYHDPDYRLFEGASLWNDAFWKGEPTTAVYWGTSGQRIRSEYSLDCFSLYELLTSGVVVLGEDKRGEGELPGFEALRAGVEAHYESIRQHGAETGESLYSCGWLLDIARCLYTLDTGKVISKTEAGIWAREKKLCPNLETLDRALILRKNPALFQENGDWRHWCGAIQEDIERFADVLERKLRLTE